MLESITPQFALQLATTAFSAVGAYFAIKYRLEAVSAKVDAVHKRLDEIEDQFNLLDKTVSNHALYIQDLRSWKHKEGDSMNAFKMARELLLEERADRG